ncbi:hypothetical protein C4564_03340 [Candidatus Microgenomates bacterium]|nr:MAG: hypothetical protein C4564_03340 [Candidatus Microgenomates bacterium]
MTEASSYTFFGLSIRVSYPASAIFYRREQYGYIVLVLDSIEILAIVKNDGVVSAVKPKSDMVKLMYGMGNMATPYYCVALKTGFLVKVTTNAKGSIFVSIAQPAIGF